VDRKFAAGPLITDTLTIPTDCTPRYEPLTRQKGRMVETVVSTLQKRLSAWMQRGIATYPREVTLNIADFNVDYPSTYILVEPPVELYTATLHKVSDYDSDEYERDGEYPLGEIRMKPHMKDLLEKIRKHGIVRKIVLTP
jgi:hypothetical protein